MGAFVMKAKRHICAGIKKTIYRIIYRNVSFGKGTTFRKDLWIYVEKGAKLTIGNECFFNNHCSLNCLESVTIGNRCLFGEGVKVYDHDHKYKDLTKPIKEQGFSTKPVVIGDDCWICSNVTILKGVTIGNHCTIGANCLIYKDIPDNTVVKSKTELIMQTINK